jgi:hypothetical protein
VTWRRESIQRDLVSTEQANRGSCLVGGRWREIHLMAAAGEPKSDEFVYLSSPVRWVCGRD